MNASSIDWSGYMEQFAKLSQLIEEMVRSPPSISPGLLALVNVTEYMKLFDRVQTYWQTQQFSLDSKRSVFNFTVLYRLYLARA